MAAAAGELLQESPHSTQTDEGACLPFSFPSQPPDIRNWFSSYEYESPDCSDGSNVLGNVSKELILNDSAEEDPIPTKEEKLVENGNLSFSKESSQYQYSLELNSFSSKGRRDLLSDNESDLKSISKEKTIGTNDIWPSELCPTQKNENFLIIKKKTCESLKNISNQIEILQCEKSFSKHDDFKLKSKQNSQQLGGSGIEEQKENVEMMAEDGFISTRKRDGGKKQGEISKTHSLIVNERGEISKTHSLIVNEKRSRLELQEENDVLRKERPFSVRGVFAEETNFCFAEKAIKEEAPGKWQFPRKSKPYARPPLKQLRLERWLRRAP